MVAERVIMMASIPAKKNKMMASMDGTTIVYANL